MEEVGPATTIGVIAAATVAGIAEEFTDHHDEKPQRQYPPQGHSQPQSYSPQQYQQPQYQQPQYQEPQSHKTQYPQAPYQQPQYQETQEYYGGDDQQPHRPCPSA